MGYEPRSHLASCRWSRAGRRTRTRIARTTKLFQGTTWSSSKEVQFSSELLNAKWFSSELGLVDVVLVISNLLLSTSVKEFPGLD
uniref:Uncharacterized protein n=1 Tax=Triticum urartu TaxID=4572 RepID=A0A8R7TJQ7_TRIUA